MSKLVLGTVQFGLKYGINNQSGIPGDFELKEIFLKANQCGIDILDTAQGYGDADGAPLPDAFVSTSSGKLKSIQFYGEKKIR